MTHVTANIVQLAFGGFNDNGSLTASTAIAATNTNWSQRRDDFFRVRFAVAETAGGDPKGPTHFVQYSVNGGAFANVESATPVQFGTSAAVTDGTAVTTQRLGASLGTFADGEYDQNGVIEAALYGANGGTEMEYGLVIDSTQTAENDIIELRLSDCDQYDNTPSITAIDALPPNAPTLGPPADNATVDGTTDQTFEWTFNSPEAGDLQTAFAFKREEATEISTVSGTPTLADTGYEVDFSPDGSLLAVGHSESPHNLTVINTNDWSVVSGTPTLAGAGFGVGFSLDGSLLAAGHSNSPHLTVINTSDWSVVSGTPTLVDSVYDVVFSPDGSLLALAHGGSPYLTVINTSDWSVVSGTPTLPNTGNGVAFSPDGSLLATAHRDSPYLTVMNTSDWSVVSGAPTLANIGYEVDFSPDGSLLAVVLSSVSSLLITNTSDWSIVSGTPTLAGVGYNVKFSPDGSLLATGHINSPYLTVINTSDWSVVSGTPTLASTGRGAVFSPDSLLLAVAHSGSPYLTVIENFPAVEWWNGTSWQDTEIFITSTTESVTFPADSW